MDTLDSLARRMATTGELRTLVRTMRSLSAVSIHQYERAADALAAYVKTVELGMQVVLGAGEVPIETAGGRAFPPELGRALRDGGPGHPEGLEGRRGRSGGTGKLLVVVFGSDHGLCGRFNREVADRARAEWRSREGVDGSPLVFAVGARVRSALELAGEAVDETFPLPGAVDGLSELAGRILLAIDRARDGGAIVRVVTFHNRREPGGLINPHRRQLYPLDPQWLETLERRPWPSRALPRLPADRGPLVAALVRQSLSVGLFESVLGSGLAEHAARLRAMQWAERNIGEQLDEMQTTYRRRRQEHITEELLDVVSGYEALRPATEV